MGGFLVITDPRHAPKVLSIISDVDVPEVGPTRMEVPGHSSASMGVCVLMQPNESGGHFYSWSTDGQVLVWDQKGIKVDEVNIELEQLINDDYENELKVVRASPKNDFWVSGDRFGVLRSVRRKAGSEYVIFKADIVLPRIVDAISSRTVLDTKAHGAEIMDIRIWQDDKITLIASCARDRTAQLFRKEDDSWVLVQTFEEHKASVNGIMFIDDGAYLLSCSGDRTIVIRKLVKREKPVNSTDLAYVPHRTIMLKSAPVSMATLAFADTLVEGSVARANVWVSSQDRSIHEFDLASGRSLRSFKAVDTDGSDAVIMDKLAIFRQPESNTGSDVGVLIAGVSPTDKSIRIYDHRGNLVCREWGHTEGVTGLAILHIHHQRDLFASGSDSISTPGDTGGGEDHKTTTTMVISTGADGTVMLRDFSLAPPVRLPHGYVGIGPTGNGSSNPDGINSPKSLTATKKPIRRVLSQTELVQFQRAAVIGNVSGSGGGGGSPSTSSKSSSSTIGEGSRGGSTISFQSLRETKKKSRGAAGSIIYPTYSRPPFTNVLSPKGNEDVTNKNAQFIRHGADTSSDTLLIRTGDHIRASGNVQLGEIGQRTTGRRARTKSTGNIRSPLTRHPPLPPPVPTTPSPSSTRAGRRPSQKAGENILFATEELCQHLCNYRKLLLTKTPLASPSAAATISSWGHHDKLEGDAVQKIVAELRHTMETIESLKEEDNRSVQARTGQSAISSKNDKMDHVRNEKCEVEGKEGVESRAESDHLYPHPAIAARNVEVLTDPKPSPSPSNMGTTIATATAGAKSVSRKNNTQRGKQRDDEDVDEFIRRKGKEEKEDDDVRMSRSMKEVDQTDRKEAKGKLLR